MLVKTYGSALFGVDARTITVEVSVTNGLHYFIVGLPDSAVKESLRRIESAIKTNDLYMPRTKLVINLAPANIRKTGSAFDLPIALGVLGASEQLEHPERLESYIFMGELSLDGSLRPIRGSIAIAQAAAREGFKGVVLPMENAGEATLADALPIFGVRHLTEVIEFLRDPESRRPWKAGVAPYPGEAFGDTGPMEGRRFPDFADVKGQQQAKRALEIAAAGSHHALLIGPPGTGKTLLASLLPGILPPLTSGEAIETTKIYSTAGKLPAGAPLVSGRPFRMPHHTISPQALAGGGNLPQPGEISLAHNGVLFLDELPEFEKHALEVLRQPMEAGSISIARANGTLDFPARFMLVGAMNPCPCGYHTHPEKPCSCNTSQIRTYLNRVSGPLLDRIDLHLEVPPLKADELTSTAGAEKSALVRQRVVKARQIQNERFVKYPGIYANAHMDTGLVKRFCVLSPEGQKLLKVSIDRLGLSARAYDRVCKVARTIADLTQSRGILPEHIAEALQYRRLDREGWAA